MSNRKSSSSASRPGSPRRSVRTAAARNRRMRRQWMSWLLVALLAFGIGYFATRLRSGAETGSNPDIACGANHYPDLDLAKGAPKSSLHKQYEGFRMSFNPDNHTPDWVGWELLASETDGAVGRDNKFHADNAMPGSPTPADYTRSGYDRGHMCPAADQKWSSLAMSDCFYMTNMTPQKKELNTGAWKTLEEKERLWAKRDSAIVIVAGPIYDPTDRKRIGTTGVRVPSAFFKVLLAPYVAEPRAIGFIYPNEKCPGNMADYAVTVDEVEHITGLDFFSSLPDDLERKVESVKSFRDWDRR